jgi:hypothetical protein
MAPMLKVLEFLRMSFARDCIKRFPGRWTSLLTLLSRKLIVWWRLWFGTFGRPKSAKSPSLETQASSYSVSGGSAVVKEDVIAASYVPASASHPSLHEHTEEQLETVGAHPPVTHVDGNVNPVVQPSASSPYTHELLSPPPMDDLCRRQSSTSEVVDDQNLSTDSLPTSSSTNLPRITDEPIVIDTATGHSSPDSPSMDLPDEPGSPASSNHPTLDFSIPEGRLLQPIHSDQIPRYTKGVTMQVGHTILSIPSYIFFSDPAWRQLTM